MTSAEYDGDNPLRLANEIDAALAKYGLATITACARRSTFLRANYASSLNACATLTRRRSQGSRPAALAEWHTDRCWQATAVTSHTVGDYA